VRIASSCLRLSLPRLSSRRNSCSTSRCPPCSSCQPKT
jgi:hypothetical protein